MAQSDWIREASDPGTDRERLVEFAQYENDVVLRVLWKNPSLPEDVWREALLGGEPEPWANPMAPVYVLTWIPREDDVRMLERAARWAAVELWREPERCSPEGKALLNVKVQEDWVICQSTSDMISLLGGWVKTKSDGSLEHREVVRLLVLCVRTTPDLTTEDLESLDLLQDWSIGGEDRRKEAVAYSTVVTDTIWFAQNPENSPWNAMYEVFEAVERKAGVQARAEHDRLLADLIRQAMPLPPVVA